jgi:hypothetical protein
MIEITLADWLRLFVPIKLITLNVFALAVPNPSIYPLIKISRLKSDIKQTFDGVTGEATGNIQVDYWAKNPEQIKAIKAALTTFFNDLSSDKENILSVSNLREQPSYEADQSLFKQTLELTLSYKE